MFVRIAMVLALVASSAPALALTVTPVHIEMTAAGNRNRAQVTVVNDSNVPLPVEATLMAALFDEDGRPMTSKPAEDFLIMPPQALIPPGATQNFRVQWLGNPLIEQSRSYLLYFSQLPIRQPRAPVAVQMVMSIGVLINVAPPRGSPALELVSSGFAKGDLGARQPAITVRNPTKVHAQLRRTSIRLTDGRWSAVIQPGLVEQKIGIGLVQPGRQRKFLLPIDVPANVGPLRYDFVMTPQR